MDLEITKEGQEPFRLRDFDIVVEDIIIGSIPIESEYEYIEGRSGRSRVGSTYGVRRIVAPFYISSFDNVDYPLLRDRLSDLIVDLDGYYIREMRIPDKIIEWHEQDQEDHYESFREVYSDGKRYHVTLSNDYELEQMFRIGRGVLEFETTELPFAESIGTAQDIHRDGVNSESGLWSFGMGLESIDETLIYTHTVVAKESFRVFNAGNQSIHPFEQELKIKISNVVGSNDMFQLTNHTNGSRSRVNVPLKSSDVVIYDGAIVTNNGFAFLNDTRQDFIELSPGWNTFEIFYCDSATIEFDFPFYYK